MRGLLRQTGTALLARITSTVLGYVTLVLLARWLRTEDYGALAAVLSSLSLLCVVCGLGLPQALLRALPADRLGNGGGGERALVLGALRRVALTTGAVALIGAALSSSLLASGAAGQGGPLRTLATVAAGLVLLPAFTSAELMGAVLRSRGSIVAALTPREVSWRLCLILLALLSTRLLPEGVQLAALLGGAALALWGIAGLQAALALRLLSEGRPTAPPPGFGRTARRLWTVDLAGAGLANLDVIVVALLLAPDRAAAYFAASRTASLAAFALNAVTPVIAPQLAAASLSGERARLQQTLTLAAALAFVPALAVLALVAGFGGRMLAVFDPGFASAHTVLLLLTLGQVIKAAAGNCEQFLNMTGMEALNARVSLVLLALTLLLVPASTIAAGITGAAAASALLLACQNLLLWSLARRRAGVETSVLGLLRLRPRASARHLREPAA